MTSFCLFAYNFHSLVTEDHYWLEFAASLGSKCLVLGAGQLCSVWGCGAAPLPTSPARAPRGPGHAAGKALLVRSRSEPLVLGHCREEGAAGDHAGENTAGADASHCCLLPGFWKGKVLAGSACVGTLTPRPPQLETNSYS